MGHMKDLDRRIRQGGDDAIAAVSELMDSKIHEDVVRELRPWLAQRRWIPVGERLPDFGDVVLVYYDGDGGSIEAAAYIGDASGEPWACEAADACELGSVTHWMPLPEPPSR